MVSIRAEVVRLLRTIPRLATSAVSTQPAVYPDGQIPEGQPFPFVSVLDVVSDVPGFSGDGKTWSRTRILQIDLWEDVDTLTDSLATLIHDALDGVRPDPTTKAKAFRVTSMVRVVDPNPKIAHTAITVTAKHLTNAPHVDEPLPFGGPHKLAAPRLAAAGRRLSPTPDPNRHSTADAAAAALIGAGPDPMVAAGLVPPPPDPAASPPPTDPEDA